MHILYRSNTTMNVVRTLIDYDKYFEHASDVYELQTSISKHTTNYADIKKYITAIIIMIEKGTFPKKLLSTTDLA